VRRTGVRAAAVTIDVLQVAAGALTGFVVGMTGVGGGALMTPILLLGFGTAPLVAVGTDLWFAAITKLAVSGLHARQRLIDWPLVRRLWLGSLPASVLTLLWLANWQASSGALASVRAAIAIAVSLTAVSLLADRRQLLFMPLYYLLVATPFFFSGLAIALLFTRAPHQVNALHAFDPPGAGVGCAAVPVGPPVAGGPACCCARGGHPSGGARTPSAAGWPGGRSPW